MPDSPQQQYCLVAFRLKLNAPYEAEAKTQAMKKRKSFAGAGESPG